MSAFERRLDPVTFEVLKSAFVSVCNEMALAVEMSAYSTVISELSERNLALAQRLALLEQQLKEAVGSPPEHTEP